MPAADARTQFQRVAVGDARVDLRTYRRYDDAGTPAWPGSGSEVVLVHGIGASERYFGPLIWELARTATVHTLELPGFGTAPKPERQLQMEDFGRIAVQALEAAGIRGAQWVGHSMGCQVVVEMALAAPDAVSSVVLLGPTINDAERSAPLQALRLLQDCLGEPPAVNAILVTDYLFRAGPRWYLKTLPVMIRHRMEERIRGVQPPVLLVRGGKDPVVRADWLARLAAARPGTRTAEVPGQPHVMMYNRPVETAALLHSAVPSR
ncbi:alpha/beta hydrolase [Arthrobacter sp. zg-Y40]|uniref:alpha/beta fold hydrolase n=1 Tax=unclassified Arthrobacter TaxID=235627 RepID=UPI001D14519C|nr:MULTISPECIES: alpha/beta fold hydrolase [unclassified Arthrobacter]MCC3276006.1 alpha/beta hydrolase [Arthrobacter sp. zg-Y20]MCC3278014.1 alpha/beta hydrolase [Arthrobacter sp. zg-Y40]MDK1316163.1 alpha/beta fold hydrolase [Arthrobacter sp. zg.Y20]WIB05555.1 alpha/beta fold hydrolase [Arthrobacter sp. zg-Y20]